MAGCQSEPSTQIDNQKSVTQGHLSQDKNHPQPLKTGAVLLKITPTPLLSENDAQSLFLNCTAESEYQWYVNDINITDEKTGSLSRNYYTRGDIIRLEAKCMDIVHSDYAEVKNSLPSIQEVNLASPELVSGRSITLHPITIDQDQDSIEYTYEWIVDSTILDQISNSTLPGEYIRKGAKIAVNIVAYDGFEYGPTFRGLTFTIPNASPIINSDPPPVTSARYTYTVSASDPDGDILSYKLELGPEGMTIDDRGQVIWNIDPETPEDTYDISIVVEDDNGAQYRQTFSLSFSYLEP